MLAVARLLDNAYDEPLSLDGMAQAAGLSRYHFVRVFRAVVGDSPHQYLIGARLRAAANRLLDTCEPITAIALDVGFNDISHFNATFRRTFGGALNVSRRSVAITARVAVKARVLKSRTWSALVEESSMAVGPKP